VKPILKNRIKNSEETYTTRYHEKVKNYLLNLKRDNKKICLATHNKNPKYYIEKMGLEYDFFDVIVYELKDVHPLLKKRLTPNVNKLYITQDKLYINYILAVFYNLDFINKVQM